jgi:predicted Fe-Mo cluster-binding NifX family protein
MGKICITAKGTTIDAMVEQRFGRTPYFIFTDENGSLVEAVTNENADAMGGVGPKSAQVLISHGAGVLITGQIGGNARRALEAAGIEVYSFGGAGTVKEALAGFRENKLQRLL